MLLGSTGSVKGYGQERLEVDISDMRNEYHTLALEIYILTPLFLYINSISFATYYINLLPYI